MSLADFSLSVIAPEDSRLVGPREANQRRSSHSKAVEIKCSEPSAIERIAQQIPQSVMKYFEVPIHASQPVLLSKRFARLARAPKSGQAASSRRQSHPPPTSRKCSRPSPTFDFHLRQPPGCIILCARSTGLDLPAAEPFRRDARIHQSLMRRSGRLLRWRCRGGKAPSRRRGSGRMES